MGSIAHDFQERLDLPRHLLLVRRPFQLLFCVGRSCVSGSRHELEDRTRHSVQRVQRLAELDHPSKVPCSSEPFLLPPLRPENNYEPDIDELERLVTSDTDAIIVNSSPNPTGAVLRRETLEKIAESASRHGLFVVSNDVYDRITYDAAHTPMAYTTVSPERLITANSLSQSYLLRSQEVVPVEQ